MAGIFISYRREDSQGYAGRINGDLKRELDARQIFRDIDSIPPGVDFHKAIIDAVGECDAMLAVIGPNWLTAKDASGRRRLDSEDDYVHIELAVALSRDVRVVPVLVGGAAMPGRADLPRDLQSLTRRQAQDLTELHWDTDLRRLATSLAQIPGVKQRPTSRSASSSAPPERAPKSPPPVKSRPAAPQAGSPSLGRRIAAWTCAILGGMGVFNGLFTPYAGDALFFGVLFLGGAYWLFRKPKEQRGSPTLSDQ